MSTFDYRELYDISTSITAALRRLTLASEQLNERGAEVVGLATLDGAVTDLTSLRDELSELASEARSISDAEMRDMFEFYEREGDA
jgi:hypothetical protein